MGDRFAGRTALVTGSTQGVGEALLHRMTAEGLDGAVVTGRDVERGEQVRDSLRESGCNAHFFAADLADASSVRRLLDHSVAELGPIDHLANCAALTTRGDVWNTSTELFDTMMAVNVRAPFQLIQGVATHARSTGRPASVVNVGSISGHGGQHFITAYCISKGALMTMTKNVAHQLMRHRIRVVTVNPGWMDTPGEEATQRIFHEAGDGWLEAAEATRPWGRLVTINELVNVLAFVLSDDAGLMSGISIDLDQSVQGAGDPPMPSAELGPRQSDVV